MYHKSGDFFICDCPKMWVIPKGLRCSDCGRTVRNTNSLGKSKKQKQRKPTGRAVPA